MSAARPVPAAFVRTHTRPVQPPLVPEVTLLVAPDVVQLRAAMEERRGRGAHRPPRPPGSAPGPAHPRGPFRRRRHRRSTGPPDDGLAISLSRPVRPPRRASRREYVPIVCHGWITLVTLGVSGRPPRP